MYPHRTQPAAASSSLPLPTTPADLPLLLSRLREYVTVNRIRGSEFFHDFDPLRSGSIAASRFRQVISGNSNDSIVNDWIISSLVDLSLPQGLSSLGQPSLTEDQFSALCTHYADPKHRGNVLWKKFISDIDQSVYYYNTHYNQNLSFCDNENFSYTYFMQRHQM